MIIAESRIVCELAPCAGNPRNSEGSFLRLRDGRIVFAYSRYHGTSAGDHAACDICAVYSEDGGESFGEPRKLVRASEYGVENVMSASLVRLGNGDAGLMYLIKHPGLTSDVVFRRSSDELESFDSETVVAPQGYPGYFVVNNDRILRRPNGELIVPAAKHPSSIWPDGDGTVRYDSRAACCFFVSRDDGRTWTQSRAVLNLPHGSYSSSGLQEPGVTELANGVLYAYFRTDMMWQYESVSLDGGEHWFAPQPSRFSSPCSPMLIKRNELSGKYYAVWNPVPEYPGRLEGPWITAGRTPLVIAESGDGYTFSASEVVEGDEGHGYCYPAMYFTDEHTMLLAYCSGGAEDGNCLCRTTIRRVRLG